MNKLILLLAIGMLSACGSSSTKNADGTEKEVTTATSNKIKEAQDVNAELEEIDGELDSLINLIN